MALRAVYAAPCVICNNIIHPGEVTRPLKSELCDNVTNIKHKTLSMIQKRNDTLSWCHLTCVSNDDIRIPICKHWTQKRKCVFKMSCLFRHPEIYNEDSVTYPDMTKHSNKTTSKTKKSRKRVCNDGRAASLRRWLINIFGYEYLKKGTGVLDVAGGKGELGFELCNLNDIPTCVIDPRKLELKRYCRKLDFGYYHRNMSAALQQYTTVDKPAEIKNIKIPKQIRCYFEMNSETIKSRKKESFTFHMMDNDDVSQYDSYEDDFDSDHDDFNYPLALQSARLFSNALQDAQQVSWTDKGLSIRTVTADDNAKIDELEEPESHSRDMSLCHQKPENNLNDSNVIFPDAVEISDFREARNIIKDCSVVVGMHPDQAAEHILEFAIQNNKPCAFIPCCVYSNQFPRRKTADGKHVRKYGDFIEYLLSKLTFCMNCSSIKHVKTDNPQEDPSINNLTETVNSLENKRDNSFSRFGIVEMDFEGKNLLIYYLGDHQPLMNPTTAIEHIARGPAQSQHWWKLTEGFNNSHNERLDV